MQWTDWKYVPTLFGIDLIGRRQTWPQAKAVNRQKIFSDTQCLASIQALCSMIYLLEYYEIVYALQYKISNTNSLGEFLNL